MQIVSNMRILVVEDSLIAQFAAKKIIRRLGFAVDLATNYTEVMQCVTKHEYALIFMDIGLPKVDGLEVNGFEVTRRLRQQGYTIPVIALTANSEAESEARKVDSGLTEIMVKPLSFDVAQAFLFKFGLLEA